MFGCIFYIHVPKFKHSKLDPKALKCIFLRYAPNQKDANVIIPLFRSELSPWMLLLEYYNGGINVIGYLGLYTIIQANIYIYIYQHMRHNTHTILFSQNSRSLLFFLILHSSSTLPSSKLIGSRRQHGIRAGLKVEELVASLY